MNTDTVASVSATYRKARARFLRLYSGACPEHGLPLTQSFFDERTGVGYLKCPRRDCEFDVSQRDLTKFQKRHVLLVMEG